MSNRPTTRPDPLRGTAQREIAKPDPSYTYAPANGFGASLTVLQAGKRIGWIKVEALGFSTVGEWMDSQALRAAQAGAPGEAQRLYDVAECAHESVIPASGLGAYCRDCGETIG